jgi:hypothetical protein
LEATVEGRPFELIIITQYGDQIQSAPGGVGYVDEMVHEAGLPARSSPADDETWLATCLRALNRRFGHRIRVRLVNPMSFYGLYLAFRFRFRGYPAVITPNGRVLVEPSVEELIGIIKEIV